ncbi:hypothetical protein [Aquimarina sp. AU474]|uniref:hypothetical protein n=1 Tax=Aquimarina sp. AU474 TaxID=2108529 RepID=UPI000D692450|nr:hypothetical protein [Aquimarina sp. AU474]
MKFKIYLYQISRISLGIFLVLYSVYTVIKYSGFLDRLDVYFNAVSVFDIGIVEALAPLVPFEEFLIGFFLIFGLFTRKILIASSVLFGFLTLFLFDAHSYSCALIHLFFFFVSIILLKKDNYNLSTPNYKVQACRIIQ